MVSLWPWSRSDDSPASFEKTLSALSGKINDTSARLDTRRQHARRYKALWTLYSSFAYLLCLVLEALVIGWRNWGPVEVSSLAGSPVLIYLVRLALDTFYAQRIGSLQRHLTALQAERESTISKLKKATRYDSTQELLDKYGGSKERKETKGEGKGKGSKAPQDGQAPQHVQRTNMPPPPTANIPGRHPQALPPPSPPQQQPRSQPSPVDPLRGLTPEQPRGAMLPGQAAGPPQHGATSVTQVAVPAYASAPASAPAWYDRVLDVLLGEDETAARNRFALVCARCRLVNGLAPPGAKTLGEVGLWRCSQCGAMNGEASADRKVAKEIAAAANMSEDEVKRKMEEIPSPVRDKAEESDVTVYSDEEEAPEQPVDRASEEDDDEEEEPAKTRRSVRQRKTAKKS